MKPVDMEYCPECGIKSTAGAKVLSGKKGTVAASMNEMERLLEQLAERTRERDTASIRLANTRGLLDAALEREQALAAHVSVLTKELGNLYDNCVGAKNGAMDRAHHVLENYDTTTLTKRDLIKQAEALEWMANEFDEQGEYRGYAIQLEERANDLRQQAAALDGKGE